MSGAPGAGLSGGSRDAVGVGGKKQKRPMEISRATFQSAPQDGMDIACTASSFEPVTQENTYGKHLQPDHRGGNRTCSVQRCSSQRCWGGGGEDLIFSLSLSF